jgi:hypothetical protein
VAIAAGEPVLPVCFSVYKSIEFSPFDMIVDIEQIMTAELNTITKDLLW